MGSKHILAALCSAVILMVMAAIPVRAALNPPTDGLELWLDATDATTLSLSGTSVTQWRDKSGNLHHATPATGNQPTYTGSIGGQPAIRFTPSPPSPRTPMNVAGNLGIAANQERTIFTVINYPGPYGNNEILGSSTGEMMDVGTWPGGSYPRLRLRNGGSNTYSPSGSVPAGTDHILTVQAYNGGSPQTVAHRNGQQIINAGVASAHYAVNTNLDIGGANFTSREYIGDLAEVMIYDRALNASERNNAGYYLAQKYGVAGPFSVPDTPLVLADSGKDWAGAAGQPHGDWTYGRYNPGAWTTFTENTQYALYNTFIGGDGYAWQNPSGNYAQLGQYSAAPSNGQWAVRRWTSDISGPVTIDYDVLRSQTGSSGQRAAVYQNGVQLWSQNLGNSTGLRVGSVTATVAPGDVIDFVVDYAGGGNSSDWTSYIARVRPGTVTTPTGLIDHLRLDENGLLGIGAPNTPNTNRRAHAADDTGNNNHFQLHNMHSDDWVPGMLGNALDFDGGNDYLQSVNTNVGDGATQLTLSAWINPDVKGSNDGILTATGPTYNALLLSGYGSGNPPAFRALNNEIRAPDGAGPVGQWTLVTGTWASGGVQHLYLNGIEVATDTTAPSGSVDVTRWYVGSDRVLGGRYYDGLIDDVGIWTAQLDALDVLKLYTVAPYGYDQAAAMSGGTYLWDNGAGTPSWGGNANWAPDDVLDGPGPVDDVIFNSTSTAPSALDRDRTIWTETVSDAHSTDLAGNTLHVLGRVDLSVTNSGNLTSSLDLQDGDLRIGTDAATRADRVWIGVNQGAASNVTGDLSMSNGALDIYTRDLRIGYDYGPPPFGPSQEAHGSLTLTDVDTGIVADTIYVGGGGRLASGAMIVDGGSLQIGTPSDRGDVRIGNATIYNQYGDANGAIAVDNASFSLYADSLEIGSGNRGNGTGLLDLRGATSPVLDVSGLMAIGYNTSPHAYGSPSQNMVGTLLGGPNMTINAGTALYVGYNTGWQGWANGLLDLGSGNSTTINTPSLMIGGGGRQPTGLVTMGGGSLQIGTPANRTGLRIGYENIYEFGTADGTLEANGGTVTAYLDRLIVGYNNGRPSGTGRGEIDLRSATSMIDVQGQGFIGNGANNGPRSQGTVTLGAGSMTISEDLFIGDTATGSSGLLELFGSMVTVGETLSILPTGDVISHILGAPAGIDLLSNTEADLDINPGGLMSILFEEPPVTSDLVWGLRMPGDHAWYFQTLLDAGLLRWDDSALAGTNWFGAIFYDPQAGETYVALIPEPHALSLLGLGLLAVALWGRPRRRA